MANPPKPWKAEYAKSARSSCRTCKNPIDKEVFRLGKMVQSKQFDGFMPMWNHASCILKKAKQIQSVDDVEGIELLRWDDQQKVRKYVDGGGPQNSPAAPSGAAPSVMQYNIEVSQTSRAACRCCNEKIMKGEVRISSKPEGQGAKGLAWQHAKCFIGLSPTTQVEKIQGWESLSAADQAAIRSLAPSSKKGSKSEVEDAKETTKGGAKRKISLADDKMPKLARCDAAPSASQSKSAKNSEQTKASDLEHQLEAQSKQLWAVKDDLKKHVTAAELRGMLDANGQDSTGSELDLRERW